MPEEFKPKLAIPSATTKIGKQPQDDVVLTPEQQTAKEKIVDLLKHSTMQLSKALEIKNKSNLPEEVFQQVIRGKIIARIGEFLRKGLIRDALEIKNKFNLSEEVFQQAAQESIRRSLEHGRDTKISLEIKKALNLPVEIFQQAVKEAIVSLLKNGGIGRILSIKNEFNLSEKFSQFAEVQQAIKERLIKKLKDCYIEEVFEIINVFNISRETIADVDQSVVANFGDRNLIRFTKWLENKEMNILFPLTFFKAQEIIFSNLETDKNFAIYFFENHAKFKTLSSQSLINRFPRLQEFITELEKILISLAEKFKTSTQATLSYFLIEDKETFLKTLQDKKNSFFVTAFEANPNYAIKLAIKFGELDELSQENIRKLYEVKDKNKDFLLEDTEYRQKTNEALLEYKNNPQILEELKRAGINVLEWLNYEKEKYFDLGEEEEVFLSDKLKTPIFRIRESLENYSSSLKNILAEYKKEFSSIIVLEDLEEVKLQIEKLIQEKEKALAENNISKAEGIDMGIEQLKKKIANPKSVVLWDKILGNLSSVDRVTKDVLSAYNVLIETETSLRNYPKDQGKSAKERREEVLKLKLKAENAKQEFVNKLKTLEVRISSFKKGLGKTLTGAIREEKANKIIGNWETVIAEGMIHLESDKATIANIFEGEGGEQGKLDNTPMTIKVWTRNPDIDLYLGNYTDCCIRIDSEHMGEESTIADYLTDIGVQVVIVYDEKKKIPVVAVWTFIGIDEDGKVALVVDNIEANTDYSSNYKNQLEDKLRKYFTEYIRSVGLKKFVQGQSNNDLVIAKMDGKYKKLGGYNRKDGYFLEGEHDENDNGEEFEDEDNDN